MKAIRTAILLTTASLIACATHPPAPLPERLSMKLDGRQWIVAYQDPDTPGSMVQYVPPGQTVDAWQEMVTQREFKGLQKTTTARQALEADRQRIDQECKDTTWNLIEDSAVDVVYEVTRRACAERQSASEIGRFLVSDQALYQVTYTANTDSLAVAKRDQWIGILAGIDVVYESGGQP